ncbi:hypothetical protein F4680DRAFT_279458 [Xylaria scruposa]|nr:hypothetical protein F4680DRAFT_279458 [Xylaria scruposa]
MVGGGGGCSGNITQIMGHRMTFMLSRLSSRTRVNKQKKKKQQKFLRALSLSRGLFPPASLLCSIVQRAARQTCLAWFLSFLYTIRAYLCLSQALLPGPRRPPYSERAPQVTAWATVNSGLPLVERPLLALSLLRDVSSPRSENSARGCNILSELFRALDKWAANKAKASAFLVFSASLPISSPFLLSAAKLLVSCIGLLPMAQDNRAAELVKRPQALYWSNASLVLPARTYNIAPALSDYNEDRGGNRSHPITRRIVSRPLHRTIPHDLARGRQRWPPISHSPPLPVPSHFLISASFIYLCL